MAAPDTEVRGATAADADAIAGVGNRSWEATYRGLIPDETLDEWIRENPAGWRHHLATWPPDTSSRVWVAEREGVVVGYAMTSPARDKWGEPPPGAGEITHLYLDPDVIGSGVGRVLFEHAAADLGARGFDPLVLWAFRDNPRAIGFYERMGLAIDVPDGTWVLAGVPCPIVRFRGPLAGARAS